MTKLRLAFPGGDKALIRSRLLSRQGHYMNPALLDSQFAILKPAESGTDPEVTPHLSIVNGRLSC